METRLIGADADVNADSHVDGDVNADVAGWWTAVLSLFLATRLIDAANAHTLADADVDVDADINADVKVYVNVDIDAMINVYAMLM